MTHVPGIIHGSIPEPQADVASLLETVKALKEVLEGEIGQRTGLGAATVTHSTTAPIDPHLGNVWIRPSSQQRTNKVAGQFYYYDGVIVSTWDGHQWVPQSVSGEYFEWHLDSSVTLNNAAVFFAVYTTPMFGAAGQIWKFDWRQVLYDTSAAVVVEGALRDPDVPTYFDTDAGATFGANLGYALGGSCVVELSRPTRLQLIARDQGSTNGSVLHDYTSVFGSLKSTFLIGTRLA